MTSDKPSNPIMLDIQKLTSEKSKQLENLSNEMRETLAGHVLVINQMGVIGDGWLLEIYKLSLNKEIIVTLHWKTNFHRYITNSANEIPVHSIKSRRHE